MLLVKMYIRCPIDHNMLNPRDFLMGQIKKIDQFAASVEVTFNDPYNYMNYYDGFPKSVLLPISMVKRCEIFDGAIVNYSGKRHRVVACVKKTDDFYEYYLENCYDKEIITALEKDIIAPFSVGRVDPAIQLKSYEFQNPCWFFGRTIVNKTMNVLDNSIYGFKELAGCKIFLMPHQLKTVMRCLQNKKCRYMLADEVGMGKTIEAASILKVYLSRHSDTKVLVITPKSLMAQWKTELFMKFGLYEGENENNNDITFLATEYVTDCECGRHWDFIIIDEAHRLLFERNNYNAFHRLSKDTENLLLLSATPVQQKRGDYLDLLRLILPEKYDDCSQEDFDALVEKQGNITKAAAMVLSSIEDLEEVIRDCTEKEEDPHDNEDCEDLFEEISDGFKKLWKIVDDGKLKELYTQADYDSEDVGTNKYRIAISYLCENYQIEKNIIRNRRECLKDLPVRELIQLQYQLNPDKNFYEYSTYQELVNWITEEELTEGEFHTIFKPLFGAFFSSPWAFEEVISNVEKNGIKIREEIRDSLRRWKLYEEDIAGSIIEVLDEPEEYSSRIVKTIYYMDEYISDKKVVLFTNYTATFKVYEKILQNFYTEDGFSCFRIGMDADELEVNACRFQNDKTCTVMLCDESGGEGRNFQCADYIIHIDLPWDANTIEQRIGRLDRIGREGDRPIIAVVPYAEETLEEELFKFWNEGLRIFEHSLSGLEIIMNDINEAIVSAIIKDFRFGLTNEIQNVIERSAKLKEEVREEQHFDTAAYLYRPMNQELISLVNYYTKNENQLFANAMLEWAKLSGFRDVEERNDLVAFNENSFSTRSAENSLLIPPDWDAYFEKKQNQFLNRILELKYGKQKGNSTQFNRTIEGTFSRKQAIKSDYAHFFAPGDDIFDCIVDNAMKSCRGQAAAFAITAPFNWKGFIYTWSLMPNEKLLIQNRVPLSYLSAFRNYLAVEQVICPIGFKSEEGISDSRIISEYEKTIQSDYEANKDRIEHLGRRGKEGGFLNIPGRYRASNIDYFRSQYPQERWGDFIDKSRKISKDNALKILKKRSHIAEAGEEINRILTSILASAQYYEQEPEDYDALKRIYEVVLESLSKPVLKLESVCFVWMVRK